jgi:hypothetical protein
VVEDEKMNRAAAERPVAVVRPTVIVLAAAALMGGGFGARAASFRSDDPACPRIAQARSLPLRPGGFRLRGDIDGDGSRDVISVRYAPKSRASCGFLLVIKTRSRVLAVRVPEWYKPPQDLSIRRWPFAEPFLVAIVQLQAHGSQIVVARSHGAAVVNVSLYGVVNGNLVRLDFHPSLAGVGRGELSLFGTIGTGDTNARCVRGGPLVLLGRGPTTATGRRWLVSRSEYRLIRDHFRRTRIRTVRLSTRRANALAHRWGMDALPFTGCTVVRGRRL